MEAAYVRFDEPAPTRADLAAETDLLVELLRTGDAWRERHVEEMIFGEAHHVRIRSTYQFRLHPQLIRRFARPSVEQVNLLLPVASREKRKLLGFDVTTSNDSPAHLLSRAEAAELQVHYLRKVAIELGLDDLCAQLPAGLMTALCRFSPGMYQRYRTKRYRHPLVVYLQDELPRVGATRATVAGWCDRIASTASKLARILEEPASDLSSAENVLFALLEMDARPTSRAQLEDMLDRWCSFLDDVEARGGHGLLLLLAEYGRRYTMVIEVEVPVGTPFTVTVAEDRPLETRLTRQRRRRRTRSVQFFALGDAASAHLEVRSTDHAVRLVDVVVRHPTGENVPFRSIEAERVTDEATSIYSSDPERPYVGHVHVELAVARAARIVAWSLGALVLIAAVIALFAEEPTDRNEREAWIALLGVLAVPTTFAATLVLTREQTALAARLQRAARAFLSVATALLWVIVLWHLAPS